MCEAIAHRGPDDSDTFCDGFAGLGARRLSIIDIAGGHMPMSNKDGSVWIAYNGEVTTFWSSGRTSFRLAIASRQVRIPKSSSTYMSNMASIVSNT